MRRFALLSVLALSACESQETPTACGPIPQATVNAGETTVVTACFTDANGDMLSYTATSSNSCGGHGLDFRHLDHRRGGGSGQRLGDGHGDRSRRAPRASRAFRRSWCRTGLRSRGARCRRPRSRSASRTRVDASSYFTEPDGEALAYSAASFATRPWPRSRWSGSTVTVTALAKGTANCDGDGHGPRRIDRDADVRGHGPEPGSGGGRPDSGHGGVRRGRRRRWTPRTTSRTRTGTGSATRPARRGQGWPRCRCRAAW